MPPTGIAKVIYVEEKYMAVYECYRQSDDGYCVDRDAYIELLSRDQDVPPEGAAILYDAAAKACYTRDMFTRTSHTSKNHAEICNN